LQETEKNDAGVPCSGIIFIPNFVKVVYLVQKLKMGLIQTSQLPHGPTFLTKEKLAKNYLNEKYKI
jgi:hypothetical protein